MILFESDKTSAAFYFAAEEYVMRVFRPAEPALMLWSVDDTVVIGANQVAKAECDVAYAASASITIARRPSGGGAIFTDRNAFQYTLILPYSMGDDTLAPMRERLAKPVVEALSHYGVRASLEGRNDIVIDGKKCSGTSQFIKSDYICSHGTLLFNTDLEKLTRVLTVDREKIETKAIASVRSRVTNISEHIAEKDICRFREAVIRAYGQEGNFERRGFEDGELLQIEELKKHYDSPEWNFGREPAFTFTNKKRFPGGQLEVFLDVKGGMIESACIKGDFLALRPVAPIEQALAGVMHREEAIKEALRLVDVRDNLGSLGEDELIEVLM